MSQDLLRLIDGICRDKNIERDAFIDDLLNAIVVGLRKTYGEEADVQVSFDRMSGKIAATRDGQAVGLDELGRIATQVVKQGLIQKTRERERSSIFEEFSGRQGTVVTGSVARVEGPALIVNIGRTEGFLPRSEQIPGESHQAGDRIRAMILEVREMPHQIRVVLSRSHPDFIARLFELEVPEIAEHIIEIKALAREAGYRTKVAVASIDMKVDAVGACVGVRGSRIRNIVDELGGEKIDIVRWNESSQILIGNALKPAEIQEIALCFELGKATVVVGEDQLSLAIGKRGQNVRLAARLTQWDIDIVTPTEYNKNLEIMEHAVKRIEGADDVLIDKLIAFGCTSVEDIELIDTGPLVEELGLDPELAEKIVYEAGEEIIKQAETKEAEEKAKAERAALGLPEEEPAAPGAVEGQEAAEGQQAIEGHEPAEGLEIGAGAADNSEGGAGAIAGSRTELVAAETTDATAAPDLRGLGDLIAEPASDVAIVLPASESEPRPVEPALAAVDPPADSEPSLDDVSEQPVSAIDEDGEPLDQASEDAKRQPSDA